MKIFGIGIHKTGLTSLAKSLELLGYEGLKYPSPNQYKYFMSSSRLQYGVDTPFMYQYKELDTKFPKSRFIVTLRENTEEWLRSVINQHKKRPLSIMSNWEVYYRLRMYGRTDFNLSNQVSVRDSHYKSIRDYFSNRSGDVLYFNIFLENNPWIKLCDFLNVPIPYVPYPHENKSDLTLE